MVKLLKYNFFYLFILWIILLNGYQSYCQIDTANYPTGAKVNRKFINFHINDSTIPFTIFIDSHLFYFRDGFVDDPWDTIKMEEFRFINKKSYRVIYPLISDTIINIYSAFPKLTTNDYVLNSNNNDTLKFLPNKNWAELENSFILYLFSEPSLYFCEGKKAIRVICNPENNVYRFARIEFNKNEININCSFAKVYEDATCKLFWNTTCSLPKKKAKALEKIILDTNFGL